MKKLQNFHVVRQENVFDKNPFQCLYKAANFSECVQHLSYDVTFTVILKIYSFGTVSRIFKIQRAKQVRIEFPVDLDAET